MNKEKASRSQQTQAVIAEILALSLADIPFVDLLVRVLEIILDLPWLIFKKTSCVFIKEEERFVLKAHKNLEALVQKECAFITPGRCLCGQALASGTTLFAPFIDERHEIFNEEMEPHGHYCLPIKSKAGVHGILTIYLHAGHRYDKREEEFLKSVADTLAGIINRKQVEASLRENEKKFRQIFDQSSDAIYLHDRKGKIMEVNDTACKRLGYTRSELLRLRMNKIVPDYYKKLMPARIAGLEKEDQLIFESGDLTRDGKVIPVEVSSTMITHEGRKAILSIVRDISQRKRTEEALSRMNEELERRVNERTAELEWTIKKLEGEIKKRIKTEEAFHESEVRFSRLAANVPDILFRYSFKLEEAFVFANSALTKITGYRLNELNREMITRLVHPEDQALMQQALQDQASFEQPVTLRWLCKDKREIWVEQRLVPVYLGGELVAVEGIARDITDRKKTAMEIARLNRDLEKKGCRAYDRIASGAQGT